MASTLADQQKNHGLDQHGTTRIRHGFISIPDGGSTSELDWTFLQSLSYCLELSDTYCSVCRVSMFRIGVSFRFFSTAKARVAPGSKADSSVKRQPTLQFERVFLNKVWISHPEDSWVMGFFHFCFFILSDCCWFWWFCRPRGPQWHGPVRWSGLWMLAWFAPGCNLHGVAQDRRWGPVLSRLSKFKDSICDWLEDLLGSRVPGLCETPNGSFRVLQDSGRGWLQGKGLKRQRVPISAMPRIELRILPPQTCLQTASNPRGSRDFSSLAVNQNQWFAHVCTIRGQGDVILWDSRLVHQGGAPASARASRAVAPCGQRHRGCYGRMVSYMCCLTGSHPPRSMSSYEEVHSHSFFLCPGVWAGHGYTGDMQAACTHSFLHKILGILLVSPINSIGVWTVLCFVRSKFKIFLHSCEGTHTRSVGKIHNVHEIIHLYGKYAYLA